MGIINNIISYVHYNLKSTQGQTLVEYALILLLIAIVVLFIVMGLGSTVNSTYSKINSSVSSAATR